MSASLTQDVLIMSLQLQADNVKAFAVVGVAAFTVARCVGPLLHDVTPLVKSL